MSENKRSRKYSNLKLAKKDVEPPKILLKPKDKPSTAAASPSISIATRDPAATAKLAASPVIVAGPSQTVASSMATNNPSSASTPVPPSVVSFKPLSVASSSSTSNSNTTTGSYSASGAPLRDLNRELQPPAIAAEPSEKSSKMSVPLTLINEHQQLDSAALTHSLHDTNTHFFVIGVIGPQGVGKSTLINMLQSTDDIGKTALHEHFIQYHGGIFATKRTAAQQNSAQPTTEGVQMFITGDRHVLLDACPVLCNPQRKDAALSELDDLRLIAFMLSVCHTVLVVDSGGGSGGARNVPLLRLLQMGELLKPSLDLTAAAVGAGSKLPEQLVVERAHFPAVMFVQNLTDHWTASHQRMQRLHSWYGNVFAQSNMRMFGGNVRARDVAAATAAAEDAAPKKQAADGDRVDGTDGKRSSTRATPLNWFAFPRATVGKGSVAGRNQVDMTTVVQQFRRWVLMAPRTKIGGGATFSERNWSTLVTTVWESHKSSYFLRKYEADMGSRNGGQ